MTPVRIPPQPRALLQRLGAQAAGRGLRAYAVGGCVRDWLLGRRGVVDVDVVVEGDGIALSRDISRAVGAAVAAVHEQFGTATLRFPDGSPLAAMRLDVASSRRETYARPGAYPRVSPGTIREDLFRRDFTVNAMAVELSPERFGGLVDPFGGRRDLRQRRLRILHARSFLDDPSRILRGVRFLQRFALRWDRATEQAARRALAQGALGWLNRGRLERELLRMVEEPDPLACLRELAELLRA